MVRMTDRQRQDTQAIFDLWVRHINKTVVRGDLFRMLNDFMARGVSSDYLLFVMQYVVKNHCNLNHIEGFKYYVDKDYIKQAYERRNMKRVRSSSFYVAEPQDVEQRQNIEVPQDRRSFDKIFRRRK